MPGTRKLGRVTANRMAMLRGMVTLLLETGKVDTTLTRAKEVRALAEKMITLGKKNTLASRRQALAFITKEDVVKKVFDQIAPENEGRNGGYTAIYKLGPRRGDGAEMARIVLISEMEKKAKEAEKASKKSKKAAKVEEAPAEEAPVAEETVEA
jgi:large subunit ribosomal protein L17